MTPRSHLVRLGVMAASALLALAAVEVGLRAFDPQPLVAPLHEEVVGVTAPMAGARGRFYIPGLFDTTISINAQRFRGGAPVEAKPHAGTTRIAMLGDSMTFGYGVNDDATYPIRLEQRLNAAVGTGRHVEAINAGVIGAGTGAEALWYERWVSRFEPHIVVLNVFHNDVEDDEAARLFVHQTDGTATPRVIGEITSRSTQRAVARRIPGYAFAIQHSHLAALIKLSIPRIAAALSGRPRSAGSPTASAASGPARASALQEAELLYLRDRVVRDRARLVVIFIPARGALYPEMPAADQDLSESAAIFGMLAKTCEREGILWFDSTSRVRELAAAARTRFFLDRDAHPTAAGYDAIAEAVSGFLRPLL